MNHILIISFILTSSLIGSITLFYIHRSIPSLAKISMYKWSGIGKLGVPNNKKASMEFLKKLERFLLVLERPVINSAYFKRIVDDSRRYGFSVETNKILKYKILYPIMSFSSGAIMYFILGEVEVVPSVLLILFMAIGIGIFFSLDKEIAEKKERYYFEVIMELPRFIKTIRYSPENKPLIAIVKDYLKIAKPSLYMDLRLLYADLELSHSAENALVRFSQRIGIQEVRELVSVLVCAERGDKRIAYISLIYIENKLIENGKRIIRRKLGRRPENIEIINDILLYSLGMVFIVPMAIVMLRSFGIMIAK